jgi:hypothetical protein
MQLFLSFEAIIQYFIVFSLGVLWLLAHHVIDVSSRNLDSIFAA